MTLAFFYLNPKKTSLKMFNARTFSLLSLVLTLCYTIGIGQIYVDANENVGVGTSTFSGTKQRIETSSEPTGLEIFNTFSSTSSKRGIHLNVNGTGSGSKYGILNYTYQSSSSNSHGIYSYSQNSSSGNHYGIYNRIPIGGTGKKYGLYNDIQSSTGDQLFGIYNYTKPQGSGSNYGVYSKVDPSTSHSGVKYGFHTYILNKGSGMAYGVSSNIDGGTGYAGFFLGDVYVAGTFHNPPSDERLKEDVKDISSALGMIVKLKPKTYKYKESYKKLGLKTDKKRYGFLAQEIERVMPELVSDVQYPGFPGEEDEIPAIDEGSEGEPVVRTNEEEVLSEGTYKSIDYIAMIAVLTQAIKEQQEQIEDLQKAVEKLKK